MTASEISNVMYPFSHQIESLSEMRGNIMTSILTWQSRSNWSQTLWFLLFISGVSAAGPVARNECANPPPGTIFCEDFEGTNPKAHFDDYDGNPDSENQVVTDSGPAGDASNKAVRFRVPAGQSGTSDLIKVLSSSYDKLFARWYIKYEPGFNFAALNHGGGLAAGDRNYVGSSGNRPNGNDFAWFGVQYQENTSKPYVYSYYRGMYQDCVAQGSCYGDSLPCVYDTGGAYCTKAQHRPTAPLPTFQAGQWYCVEEMIDMGTPTATGTSANGGLTLWLDSQVVGTYQDLWIRTTTALKIQSLWLALFHHDGTHSVVGELVDNVVVSTQRVGCGATQQLNAPTNLRILN